MIEYIISEGNFQDNMAVSSFCNPELKHVNKYYSRVDYSSVCSDVFYCEVDALDLANTVKAEVWAVQQQ